MALPKGRTRYWATIVYDLNIDVWIEYLKDSKVSFFISPIHDSDCDSDGVVKKSHYHVLLLFDGVKTADQADLIFSAIGGVGCEKVNSIRSYARYLCHMDNPDKAQYNPNDVISFGPLADYVSFIGLPCDRYSSISEMMDWVDKENCISFSKLLRYARNNNEIWFRVLCDSSAIILREYIKSFAWELNHISLDCEKPADFD